MQWFFNAYLTQLARQERSGHFWLGLATNNRGGSMVTLLSVYASRYTLEYMHLFV